MIKVTVKETVLTEKGYQTNLVIKEHASGDKASVFNGVLTIFSNAANAKDDFANSIAGYEPSHWSAWAKA